MFTKIAVNNLPAALFSAVRFTSAGVILMLIAGLYRGDRWPRSWIDWRHLLIAGEFMVFINNGLNIQAIQHLPSNQSTLLNGTNVFWIAGLGVFGPRGHPLTTSAITGLIIGFSGAVLMLIPNGRLTAASAWAQAGVLTAYLAWSLR